MNNPICPLSELRQRLKKLSDQELIDRIGRLGCISTTTEKELASRLDNALKLINVLESKILASED